MKSNTHTTSLVVDHKADKMKHPHSIYLLSVKSLIKSTSAHHGTFKGCYDDKILHPHSMYLLGFKSLKQIICIACTF